LKSDSRESHLQPAWYQSDNGFVILLFKNRYWTGFADGNGFAYFCRNKSRSNRRFM